MLIRAESHIPALCRTFSEENSGGTVTCRDNAQYSGVRHSGLILVACRCPIGICGRHCCVRAAVTKSRGRGFGATERVPSKTAATNLLRQRRAVCWSLNRFLPFQRVKLTTKSPHKEMNMS